MDTDLFALINQKSIGNQIIQNVPNKISEEDILTLLMMGFDRVTINKIITFLDPPDIFAVIDLLSTNSGIHNHPFISYSSNKNECHICGDPEVIHIYSNEDDDEDNFLLFKKPKVETNKICELCEEQISNQLPQIQCNHLFCYECWYQYIKQKIKDFKVNNIKCIQHNCNTILEENFIIFIIECDKELKEKYEQFKLKQKILDDKNLKFCPIEGCESYAQRKNEIGNNVTCLNGHKFCFNCLKKWHSDDNRKCLENIDKDFFLWKKNKIIKQCPNCKIWTEKNSGCNHMICAECQYQWCWLCLKKYNESHYLVGECQGLQFVKLNDIKEKKRKGFDYEQAEFLEERMNRIKRHFREDVNNNDNDKKIILEKEPEEIINRFLYYLKYNILYWLFGLEFTYSVYFEKNIFVYFSKKENKFLFACINYIFAAFIGFILSMIYKFQYSILSLIIIIPLIFSYKLHNFVYRKWCEVILKKKNFTYNYSGHKYQSMFKNPIPESFMERIIYYLEYNLIFWFPGWIFTLVMKFDYDFNEWFPDLDEHPYLFFYVCYINSFLIGICEILIFQISAISFYTIFAIPSFIFWELENVIYSLWCKIIMKDYFYSFNAYFEIFR